MIEITSDMLYWLFKDIPEGTSPYGYNIFEPDIDYSEGISDYVRGINVWLHNGTAFTIGVDKNETA